ncbi:hypothetical protein BS47DRAFT_1365174 [Hydnum rufescens UP504]|uniref:Uncharacterized protein n=1 Tax=Hydnum rufescens UP504 TaxID=1448309 RepID=A0A9P6DQ36_9AGAM|nr:hypothetical protein BS47DRAFT_1365174 [Hydnum rufescens UP504]
MRNPATQNPTKQHPANRARTKTREVVIHRLSGHANHTPAAAGQDIPPTTESPRVTRIGMPERANKRMKAGTRHHQDESREPHTRCGGSSCPTSMRGPRANEYTTNPTPPIRNHEPEEQENRATHPPRRLTHETYTTKPNPPTHQQNPARPQTTTR